MALRAVRLVHVVVATLGLLIADIVQICSNEQVIWIYAISRIALVADE
jgi:hypothetical protein